MVGGKRKLMVGDSSGREVIKQKVEEIAQQIMNVKVDIEKDDPRINKIYTDIHKLYDGGRRSAISDDELKNYVEKYFILEPVLDELKSDE
jgi:isopropylmalate/homocitrate/citramalate synthase